MNKGCDANLAPDPENVEVGFDPHCLTLPEDALDRLWQQKHCGIYRIERPATRVRAGNAAIAECPSSGPGTPCWGSSSEADSWRYPSIRLRIIDEQDRTRRHIEFFVNRVQVGKLDVPLTDADEVHILQALSGG